MKPEISDEKTVCQECERERKPGEKDYNPAQFLLREEIGWYSGDDGELCGECLAGLMRRVNRGS